MECNKYADEKIGETDSAEFREHRSGCDGCRRDLEELREVRSLYKDASAEKYRGGVPRLGRSRASWIPLAAAAALLVGVFSLILRQPAEVAVTTPEKSESTSSVFVRIHLEPWAADVRVGNALEDCWKKLEQLEGTRR